MKLIEDYQPDPREAVRWWAGTSFKYLWFESPDGTIYSYGPSLGLDRHTAQSVDRNYMDHHTGAFYRVQPPPEVRVPLWDVAEGL